MQYYGNTYSCTRHDLALESWGGHIIPRFDALPSMYPPCPMAQNMRSYAKRYFRMSFCLQYFDNTFLWTLCVVLVYWYFRNTSNTQEGNRWPTHRPAGP